MQDIQEIHNKDDFITSKKCEACLRGGGPISKASESAWVFFITRGNKVFCQKALQTDFLHLNVYIFLSLQLKLGDSLIPKV